MLVIVDLGDVLDSLEPLQRAAVTHIYREGHSLTETAALLAVEIGVVGAALAVAFRAVARHVLDTDDTTEADQRVFRAPADRLRLLPARA